MLMPHMQTHVILTFLSMVACCHWSPHVPVILPSFHPLSPLPFHQSINVNQQYLFSGYPLLLPTGSGFVYCMRTCAWVCYWQKSLLKPLITQLVSPIQLSKTAYRVSSWEMIVIYSFPGFNYSHPVHPSAFTVLAIYPVNIW